MAARKYLGFCLVSFLILALTAHLHAQGTRSDYERAKGLQKRTNGKLARDSVNPHWVPDGSRFWYRVDTGAGHHEFVVVEAEQGTRRAAFDHSRLAAALRKAGVEDARADRLPVVRLDLTPTQGHFDFWSGDTWYRCDTADYTLQKIERQGPSARSFVPANGPRASRRTGPETNMTFVNATEEHVELFWLDSDGQRRSYGKLEAGDQRSQHTFAGHVWLVLDRHDNPFAVFVAEEEPTTAVIGAETTRGPPRGESRRGQRERGGQSPDGRWNAFTREHNVWIRDRETDDEYPLSDDGSAKDAYGNTFRWSPDSSMLVAVRTLQGDERQVHYVESSPRDRLQPKLHSYDYLKPGDQIPLDKPQLFNVADRKNIPVSDECFPNPWSIREIRWWPDSSRFTFVYNQRGHQVLRMVSVLARTGEARAIVDENSKTFIDYANKQYTHYLDDSREIVWMSERDGWNHLYLHDALTGEVKNQITKGSWVVRDVEHVDNESRQIWFYAGGILPDQDPYYLHFCRVNFDGTDPVVLTEGDGTHSVRMSPDRQLFVDTWSRVDQPPVTELRSANDGKLVCELERADWTALRETGWQPPERFVAKGRDGKTNIHGVIFRPTNFDPTRKYPVIEEIYAGPHDAFVPKRFRSYFKAQSLAELGFVVVKMDGMGTSNRSKAFHDVCWKNLGDSGFPDRILWIKAAAKRYPYMDLGHVGIYGGSAGGQSALRALLAHGDFYHVAVADCGCHDNRMDKIWWNELWMGWPIGPHYEEQSNVTQAHKLRGKLLLVVGEKDTNVDPASTLQVADALIRADKDFDLLLIPGTGHGAAETTYGNRRRQDFFVRHLLKVEPRSAP